MPASASSKSGFHFCAREALPPSLARLPGGEPASTSPEGALGVLRVGLGQPGPGLLVQVLEALQGEADRHVLVDPVGAQPLAGRLALEAQADVEARLGG